MHALIHSTKHFRFLPCSKHGPGTILLVAQAKLPLKFNFLVSSSLLHPITLYILSPLYPIAYIWKSCISRVTSLLLTFAFLIALLQYFLHTAERSYQNKSQITFSLLFNVQWLPIALRIISNCFRWPKRPFIFLFRIPPYFSDLILLLLSLYSLHCGHTGSLLFLQYTKHTAPQETCICYFFCLECSSSR